MEANIIFLYSDIPGFANEKMANIMILISSLSGDRQQSASMLQSTYWYHVIMSLLHCIMLLLIQT